MKNITIAACLCAIVACLPSCTKFESIFDGSDRNSMAPISEAALIDSGVPADYFNSSEFNVLAEAFLAENAPNNHEDFAFVVNDVRHLPQIEGYSWPDIDFSRYSLVIGQRYRIWDALYLKDLRIVGKKIYLHICRIPGAMVTMDAVVVHYPFGAVFSKLPSESLEVVRWNDYQ